MALGVTKAKNETYNVRCNGRTVKGVKTLGEAKQTYWAMKKKGIDKLCEKWRDEVCSDVINSLRSVKLEDLV